MTLYTESLADQTDNFADVFVRENDARGYDDIMMFESTQPTPFCLEKSNVRNGQFNVSAALSVRIWLE